MNRKLIDKFVEYFDLEISSRDIKKFLSTHFPEDSDIILKRGRPKTAITVCDFILLKGARKDEVCGKSADLVTNKCIQHRKYYIPNYDDDDDDKKSVKSVKSVSSVKSTDSKCLENKKGIKFTKNLDIKQICDTLESSDEEDINSKRVKLTLKTIWK
jgi:hypothetical protein